MKAILWSIIVLGAAFGVLYVVVRRAQRTLPPIVLPSGETMPSTALQRLAWQSLAPIFLLTLAAAAVVAYNGTSVAWENDAVRLSATGLLLAALAVFTYYISRVRTWIIRDDGTLDERDRAILASAPAGQAPAAQALAAQSLAAQAPAERAPAPSLDPRPGRSRGSPQAPAPQTRSSPRRRASPV